MLYTSSTSPFESMYRLAYSTDSPAVLVRISSGPRLGSVALEWPSAPSLTSCQYGVDLRKLRVREEFQVDLQGQQVINESVGSTRREQIKV